MRVATRPRRLRRKAGARPPWSPRRCCVPAGTGAAAPAPGRPPARTPPAPGTLPLRGLDLDALTIPELQQRMDAGELTAVELTQAYLDRIDALERRPRRRAERQPRRPRRRRGQRPRRGTGTPPAARWRASRCCSRTTSDTEQMPTTAGSRALLGSEPDDATITARLRAAGAVIIGKANLSEWANFRGDELHQRVERRRRADRQPLRRSTATRAARPPAPPSAVAASLAQVADRHRDRRLDRLPGRPERRRRAQADARPGQPGRHRADLGRAGHRRPDGPARRRTPRWCCRWSPGGPGRRRHRRDPGRPHRRPTSPTWTSTRCRAPGSACGR